VSVPVRYAEQGFAGDGLQPTLRFGFQPRLKPSDKRRSHRRQHSSHATEKFRRELRK